MLSLQHQIVQLQSYEAKRLQQDDALMQRFKQEQQEQLDAQLDAIRAVTLQLQPTAGEQWPRDQRLVAGKKNEESGPEVVKNRGRSGVLSGIDGLKVNFADHSTGPEEEPEPKPGLEPWPEPQPTAQPETSPDGTDENMWHPGIVAHMPTPSKRSARRKRSSPTKSAAAGTAYTEPEPEPEASVQRTSSVLRGGQGRTRAVSIESTVSFGSEPSASAHSGLQLRLDDPAAELADDAAHARSSATPTPRSALRNKVGFDSVRSVSNDDSIVSAADTLHLGNTVTPRDLPEDRKTLAAGGAKKINGDEPAEGVFDPYEDTPTWRKLFMFVATNPSFQQFILVAIVSNCFWMGATACSPADTECLDTGSGLYWVVEWVFLLVYTFECIVMFMSYPPCNKPIDSEAILNAVADQIDGMSERDTVFEGEQKRTSRHDLVLGVRKFAPRIVLFMRVDASTSVSRKLLLLTTILRVCKTSDRIPKGQRPKSVVFLQSFPLKSDGHTVDIRALRRVQIPGYDVADDVLRTREYVYLKDSWNWLDILCVLTGYLDMAGLFDNVSFLRVFRVLRVLRTVTRIPMLKAIVQAVFKSGPMVASTGVLILLVVILFGVSGVQFFGGALRNRCYDPLLLADNSSTDIGPTVDDPLCYRGACPLGLECMMAAENGDHDLGGFDNIGTAMLTVVQCISLEGWVGYSAQLSDASSPWVVVYFLMIVFLVSLFTMNLVLAVLKDSLHTAMETMREQDERLATEKDKLAKRNKDVAKRFNFVQSQMVARNGMERKARAIIRHPAFDQVIFACIIVNTMTLATEYPGMSQDHKGITELSNAVFAGVFCIEMFLKIQGQGMKIYVRSGFNLFDGLVVILTIWSQLLLWIMDLSAEDGSKSIRLLYLLRILRLLKVFRYIQSLQLILENMRACLQPFFGMFLLLIIFLFIFAMAGLQLFGGKMPLGARSNFNTLGDALVTVFQICTGEDWNQVMFDAVEESGPWACAYFIVCFMLGSYVVMDLMLAILLEKFQSKFNKRREEAALAKQEKASTAVSKMPELKPLSNVDDMELLDQRYLTRELLHMYNDFQAGLDMSARERRIYLQVQRFLKKGSDSASERTRRQSIGDWLKISAQDPNAALNEEAILDEEEEEEEEEDDNDSIVSSVVDLALADDKQRSVTSFVQCQNAFTLSCSEERRIRYDTKIFEGPSLGCIARDNCLRVGLADIIYSSGFRNVILIFILASSLMLAIEPGIEPSNTKLLDLLAMVDWVFNTVFLVEAVAKIIVFGFIAHEKAYLRSGANCLDFFLVMASFALAGMKSLRTVRVLRPLRAISRDPGMQLVLNTLVRSGPELSNVGVFLAVVWTVFGILGVAFFGGQFHSCNERMELWNGAIDYDRPLLIGHDGCVGNYVNEDGTLTEREWTRAYYNFDNFGQACVTLFVVSTREGWLDIMWNGMDATGVGLQPIRESSWWNCIFFLSFIMVGYYFCLNIFLGVIFDHFSLVKAEQGGPVFMTEKQREWYDASQTLTKMKLPYYSPEPPPGSSWAKITAYNIATDRTRAGEQFDVFILVCVFANIGLMMTQSYGQSDQWTSILFAFEVAFTLVFSFEACLKIYGLGFDNYTKVIFNSVDFVIVLASVLDLATAAVISLTGATEEGGQERTGSLLSLLRFVRIFRLQKLVRNFKAAERVQRLLLTLYQSIPSMKNVGGVLFILYYTFAVLGTSLFANAERQGEIDEHTNFDSFGAAMMTLCRISTGEAWPDVLKGLVNGLRQDHFTPDGAFVQGNAFVRISGPIFFISFIILSDFFFFNLLATIVIDQYDSVEETAEDLESMNLGAALQRFKEEWSEKDPLALGVLSPKAFTELLREMPQPIGIASGHTAVISDGEQRRLVNVRLIEMQVPIRADGLIHFREALLHIARHLIGLDVEDKLVRGTADLLNSHTEQLVRTGGSLKDEYVGAIGKLKKVKTRKADKLAAAEARSGPGLQRGADSDEPRYTTAQLVAAQRIQARWTRHVERQKAILSAKFGSAAFATKPDLPTGSTAYV